MSTAIWQVLAWERFLRMKTWSPDRHTQQTVHPRGAKRGTHGREGHHPWLSVPGWIASAALERWNDWQWIQIQRRFLIMSVIMAYFDVGLRASTAHDVPQADMPPSTSEVPTNLHPVAPLGVDSISRIQDAEPPFSLSPRHFSEDSFELYSPSMFHPITL